MEAVSQPFLKIGGGGEWEEKLKQQERPSIRKTLAVLKEKAAARSSQQAKEKIKERGLSR